ncbi:MAG TPA: hypothetical protein VGI68_17815 [Mycobacterium sp.]|jgi:hypothetical protein
MNIEPSDAVVIATCKQQQHVYRVVVRDHRPLMLVCQRCGKELE